MNMRISGRTIGIVLPRDDAVTIEDDPTAVPDPKESADNNITFPVDI